MTPVRPEHRSIDPHADDVVNLGRDVGTRATLRLECVACYPDPRRTIPVRYADDPDGVVRCAACGKKHSDASLTTREGR